MSNKVEQIYNKAKKTVTDNERIQSLLNQAIKKLDQIQGSKEDRESFIGQLKTMIRMVKVYVEGRYNAFSNKTLLMLVFAILYFIIPTDLLPDFIPVLGFTDDISIIYYVVKNFAEDIEAFKEWEAAD